MKTLAIVFSLFAPANVFACNVQNAVEGVVNEMAKSMGFTAYEAVSIPKDNEETYEYFVRISPDTPNILPMVTKVIVKTANCEVQPIDYLLNSVPKTVH